MLLRMLGLLFAATLALAGTAGAQTQGKTELLWYGQSAFEINTPGGKVIMVGPWITGGTKVPPELKDLSKIGKIDDILVTDGHGDHLGDGIELAKTHNAP